MAANKTQENDGDVATFLDSVEDEQRRSDAQTVCELMTRISGEAPKMWGDSIVGFGKRHMVYASGRELDWFTVGFSPRKQELTLYIMDGFSDYDEKLARLGKHRLGKACLYIKRLDQVDMDVLEELIASSVAHATSQG